RRRHTRLVSDWSSDVCSSDLCFGLLGPNGAGKTTTVEIQEALQDFHGGGLPRSVGAEQAEALAAADAQIEPVHGGHAIVVLDQRSEERRVGEECRSAAGREA